MNTHPRPGYQKIQMGGAGGAAALVFSWLVSEIWDVHIPAQVASALGTLFALIPVYFMPETYRD